MIDYEKLINELQKIHQFLYGCHLATENIQANECFHKACHYIDELIVTIIKDNYND